LSTYFSISSPSEGYFEDKASKFLAYAFPCYADEELKKSLEIVKTLHPKASHHCYAYRIGIDKNNFRANDDGEPSGSAGRPILGQIDSFGLSNVLIIVVRYYGGTNLGVSGLINAYKKSAHNALEQANVIEKEIVQTWQVSCTYTEVNDLFNQLKKIGIDSWKEDYSDLCKIQFIIPLSIVEALSLWIESNAMSYRVL
jgi:uncharacterized YigZ family protein